MSSLVSDILIWLLLLGSIGFAGISLMGLLIFPDIRSRMYTALRAALICIGCVLAAAIIYALTRLADGGGEQYSTFLIHILFIGGMMAVAVMIINRQLLEKTQDLVYCGNPVVQKNEEKENKS